MRGVFEFMRSEFPRSPTPLTGVTRPSKNADNAALKDGCSDADKRRKPLVPGEGARGYGAD